MLMLASMLIMSLIWNPVVAVGAGLGIESNDITERPVVGANDSHEDRESSFVLLEAGQRVRFKTIEEGSDWCIATFDHYRNGAVTVQIEEDPSYAIAVDELRAFEFSSGVGGHAGKGAKIGAGVGGLAMLGIGIALASSEYFDTGGGQVVGATMAGALAGGLVGSLVGVMIRSEQFEKLPNPSDRISTKTSDEAVWVGLVIEF